MNPTDPTTGELQFEHQWARVIIPVSVEAGKLYNGTGNIPQTHPVLSAHCNVCDAYYTKVLHVGKAATVAGFLAHAGLPRFGCIDPRIGRGI